MSTTEPAVITLHGVSMLLDTDRDGTCWVAPLVSLPRGEAAEGVWIRLTAEFIQRTRDLQVAIVEQVRSQLVEAGTGDA